MGKNGERILWGKHFSSFSPLKKNFERRLVENRHKDGEKWGKMGKEFYGESIFPHKKKLRKTFSRKSAQGWGKMGKEFYGESILRLAIFPIFPHYSPLAPPHIIPGDGISSICLTIDNLKNLINFASLCVLTLDVHNAVILFR